MKGGAWRGLGGVGGLAGLGAGARRARLCLYGVALAFALFAAFLVFAPSLPAPSPSSPGAAWFDGFLASASPYRAQVSGFFSSLLPANSTSSSSFPGNNSSGAEAKAGTGGTIGGSVQNDTTAPAGAPTRISGSEANASPAEAPASNGTAVPFVNQTGTGSAAPAATHSNGDAPPRRGDASNSSAVSVPVMENVRPVNGAANAGGGEEKSHWIEAMGRCDMFSGNWVRDDSYPLYQEGSCSNVGESFNCFGNGRPDKAYQRLRWKPSGCSIPRLNQTDMLERLRGKRLVFVGDSLNRNMWQSLICILRNSGKDKRKLFEDYNCTVEFFRSPFLVQEWKVPRINGNTKETLRLDRMDPSSSRYKDADIIVFNTGHWWTHKKTSRGKDYYQEGDQVYSELKGHDAYRRALNTWANWVDSNVNPKKTTVFFRGYSASHFSGGQWNSGGRCDKETGPITNEQYLRPYPGKMRILEEVLHGMKTPVAYLNITRMTDYRKEGHPSVYRKQRLSGEERKPSKLRQDCSHWCLPGVPDSWNEILYAQILVKRHQMLHQ
ncbi:unnamed protein product [Alopecurus aequalis]